MKHYFQDLPGMTLVQANGKTRQDAQETLDVFLEGQGLKPQKYYYLEMTRAGEVVGAMTAAVVDSKPERNRKFPSQVFGPEKYLVLEMGYQQYLTYDDDKEAQPLKIKEHIAENGFKIKNLPMFEFAPELGENMIRVYIMVG